MGRAWTWRRARPILTALRSRRAELLLEKGYDVHGIIRRSSSFNTSRLNALYADQHEKSERLPNRPPAYFI